MDSMLRRLRQETLRAGSTKAQTSQLQSRRKSGIEERGRQRRPAAERASAKRGASGSSGADRAAEACHSVWFADSLAADAKGTGFEGAREQHTGATDRVQSQREQAHGAETRPATAWQGVANPCVTNKGPSRRTSAIFASFAIVVAKAILSCDAYHCK